ncbi:MAG: ADP-ribosylation factor family protein [Candidatus Hodarchaeales archaeon]|jgi:small GTP-binding protein
MDKRFISNRKATINTINLIQREFNLLDEKGEKDMIVDFLSRMEAKTKVRIVLLKEGKSRISSPIPEANSPDYWRAALIIIKHARLTYLEDKESFSQFLYKLKAHISESEDQTEAKEDLSPQKAHSIESENQKETKEHIPPQEAHMIESEDQKEVKEDIPLPITSKVMKGAKISLLGLDLAGKTTILHRLKTGRFIPNPTQTIGVSSEIIEIDNVKFTAWDLGGQEKFRRALWDMYTKNSEGIIFVVDLIDQQRYSEAQSSLIRALKMPHLENVPLALFFNKSDLAINFHDQNLINLLGIDEIDDRESEVFLTSAKTGEGIIEGIYWLSNAIISKNKKK